MAAYDDTESCSSRAVDSCSPAASATSSRTGARKLKVFNQVLRKLKDSGCEEAGDAGFEDRLWLHFNCLPSRYVMDVNVDRAEDVLFHMRLLHRARRSANKTALEVRPVQVNMNSNDHPDDSVHSYSSSSAQGFEMQYFQSGMHNVEDRDSFVNPSLQSSRPMLEITISAKDKPKLLSQLTSLLSELGLNIQEAHALSTIDGFSLDVFVVEGWQVEETEKLKSFLENEVINSKTNIQSGEPASTTTNRSSQMQVASDSPRIVEKLLVKSSVNEIDYSLLQFEGKVASGSYGDLFKGSYNGQEVAIKVLKPERLSSEVLKEFYQEVNIMRKLQHKNVVQFIGASTQPQNLCIVTEFMPKGNLYEYMHKQKGQFRLPSLLRAAIDISRGMEYLHQNNIIHRDLKSANLLMGENDIIKVADFGIARVQDGSGIMTSETGTYRWMAPEVIEHKPYDHMADVFSFGVVLWELLTAKLPYEFLTPLQAAVGVVQKNLRPEIPKFTHPKLVELLERCWHHDPSMRPSFSEIINILEELANEVKPEEEGDVGDKSPGGIFSIFNWGLFGSS